MVERWLLAGIVVALLAGCARTARIKPLSLQDPRLSDDQRSWLVDAEDEVAIAQARIDDAQRARGAQRANHEALVARVRAASGDLGPWQALGKARDALADQELRRARARLDHAEARARLVRAEITMAGDLGVYKLPPLRAEAARQRERLAELTREVEQATARAEDQADAAWAAWRRHLATSEAAGGFWLDVAPATASVDDDDDRERPRR